MEVNRKRGLLFIGGDLRQIRAINRISESGINVYAFGFTLAEKGKISELVCRIDDICEIKDKIDVAVLPLPYTLDGKNINCKFESNAIDIDYILDILNPDCTILAGKCDREFLKKAENRGFHIIDYFLREELQILNAIPTAEGAIQIAMEEVPYTIHSSKCLVLGNGRIGKILAKMLFGIGADVTVAARRERDRAQVYSYGMRAIPVKNLYDNIGSFDIIFNTIPTMILDADMLSKTNRKALVIDLASSPGGVDIEGARKEGIKVIWALSLPGKVAPDTAGDIIGKTILNVLDELEV